MRSITKPASPKSAIADRTNKIPRWWDFVLVGGFCDIETEKEICYIDFMKIAVKKPTLKTLANEVSLLRSFLVGMTAKDPEGVYRPEFVEEMLRVSASDIPKREFINGREFLKRIGRPT